MWEKEEGHVVVSIKEEKARLKKGKGT